MPVNLDELTELMEGATGLPWEMSDGDRTPNFYLEIRGPFDGDVNGDTGQHITVGGEPICAFLDNERDYADCALVLAAVNALPSLLADLLALQTEADRMRGALEGLLAGTNAVLGLIQLVEGRDDLPADLKLALLGNHRVNEAQAALRVAERALGGCND